MSQSHPKARPYRALTSKNLDAIAEARGIASDALLDMHAVARVLPFRTNPYVVDELIDWSNVPEDPIFQLTFPQPGMLASNDLERMRGLLGRGASVEAIERAAHEIQRGLNPHPAGQMELNVPEWRGEKLPGMQHKYRETVLFFPSQGQTCHAYCTYCFRWAQFVGLDELKFSSREAERLAGYVREHGEVSSVLFTGGDPLVMNARKLAHYIEPLLEIEHVISVRIGSKALAYWPYRFLTDSDADDLLRLFEKVTRAGKTLALMAHYSHPRELETAAAQAALRRVHASGAVVRCQAPLVRHVNDSPHTWAELWRLQVQLGAIPYYMFIERDTGPKAYFEVPLARALDIYRAAVQQISGLARTVRGPSMSATPGKVRIVGEADLAGEHVFVLEFLQARDPLWVGRPFFAKYDPQASWLDQLEPAFGEESFFFDAEMKDIQRGGRAPAWAHRPSERRKPVIFGRVEWE